MPRPSLYNCEEDSTSKNLGKFEGSSTSEYQDICRACFNFKTYCSCNQSSDEYDDRNTSQVRVLVYSAPTLCETVRRGIDSEEYCVKSRFKYQVPSKESCAVLTNINIRRRTFEIPRKLEIKNYIKSEWLNDSFNAIFISKGGIISPSFSGDLVLKIFNKSNEEIIIQEGSPIATLQSRAYDYE